MIIRIPVQVRPPMEVTLQRLANHGLKNRNLRHKCAKMHFHMGTVDVTATIQRQITWYHDRAHPSSQAPQQKRLELARTPTRSATRRVRSASSQVTSSSRRIRSAVRDLASRGLRQLSTSQWRWVSREVSLTSIIRTRSCQASSLPNNIRANKSQLSSQAAHHVRWPLHRGTNITRYKRSRQAW